MSLDRPYKKDLARTHEERCQLLNFTQGLEFLEEQIATFKEFHEYVRLEGDYGRAKLVGWHPLTPEQIAQINKREKEREAKAAATKAKRARTLRMKKEAAALEEKKLLADLIEKHKGLAKELISDD